MRIESREIFDKGPVPLIYANVRLTLLLCTFTRLNWRIIADTQLAQVPRSKLTVFTAVGLIRTVHLLQVNTRVCETSRGTFHRSPCVWIPTQGAVNGSGPCNTSED